MKNNLFELGFVHSNDLAFHETCDFNRVRRLADQIKKDGHLKNPVLVARFPIRNHPDGGNPLVNPEGMPSEKGEKLLVLDGVNRISALKLLGYPDVLVQKVDYLDQNVELTSWDHLLFNMGKEKLIERLKNENLEISFCGWQWRKEALEDEKTICFILFSDHAGVVVSQKDPSYESRVKSLYRIIAIYNLSWEIYHLHNGSTGLNLNDALSLAFDTLENCSAINILPAFKKEEVIDLASKSILFPFGVTRFVIPQRILGLEVSCSVLGDRAPLSEKNLFLKELLSYRVKNKKAKFYQESVLLFNE
jgi:hypothetical protein